MSRKLTPARRSPSRAGAARTARPRRVAGDRSWSRPDARRMRRSVEVRARGFRRRPRTTPVRCDSPARASMPGTSQLKPLIRPTLSVTRIAVGRRFERRAQHRQRLRQLRGLELERLIGLDQLLLGPLPGQLDRLGVLQRDRAEQFFLVVAAVSSGASQHGARRAPFQRPGPGSWRTPCRGSSTCRRRTGANPQSSVVPSCSTGMYSAASSTRSRTSSGVSIRGSIGAMTPTKTRWSGFRCVADDLQHADRSGSPANAT